MITPQTSTGFFSAPQVTKLENQHCSPNQDQTVRQEYQYPTALWWFRDQVIVGLHEELK